MAGLFANSQDDTEFGNPDGVVGAAGCKARGHGGHVS